MAVVKRKPTSPGRRFVVSVVTPELHKGAPYAPLVVAKQRTGGRNSDGRITTRHQGGGHKQRYRIVDFRRDKDGIPARVERLEYDPNRTAHLALLLYADGERRYIIAPKGVSGRQQADVGRAGADRGGQHAAAAQHSGRQHGPLRGTESRQGCPAGAQRRHVGAAAGPRGRCGHAAPEVRRDSPRGGRLPGDARRGRQWRAFAALAGQGRRQPAGAAFARRCAAWP